MSHWLSWFAVVLIVVGFITISVGVLEWWRWRKGSKQWIAFKKKYRIKEEGEI